MGVKIKVNREIMLPPSKESQRIGHWNPNDSLYFHKSTGVRRGYTPGWNEPVYQYRETKLETVPRPRSNPTFYSTVLGSHSYEYPLKGPAPEKSVSAQSDVYRGETTHQRQFHKHGYADHVPKREVPMSPTKPYRKQQY